MGLHFLNLLATFEQKAEDEGIDKEEIIQTLQGALIEQFPEMMGISKQILIKSLDELVALSNITLSLHTLSQANTAEEAQSWIYELPMLYSRQLAQEFLTVNNQTHITITPNATTRRISSSFSYESSLPNPVSIDSINQNLPTIA
ncbi:hypothetical protein EPA93_32485 [Ktedonosporobacter rubrisoli]|uniref:Uncharacterized protein n=1 Tax=Ktedonosporobacter rubrisoli TaxID=2509675 RepID=A0A4P6JXG1_KTERU|nr:hypothetical protein [Ktedonosporobacter rubrisoli]QBD80439.1 hypothetical protein EPA93_32485 [Ktedonosporobacter rubrisoli]